MVPWQPNKTTTGHWTHKLGRQSLNDHNCQISFTSLHWLWRKCNLTIFPLKVYGSFLLPWQQNQVADHHNFSCFKLPLAKQHLYPIKIILLQWFRWSFHLIIFKFNVAWQPNKMATGHKTHRLGRQSSNDHNCQIWFTSLHWLWRKCNLTIFPLCLWELSVAMGTKLRGRSPPFSYFELPLHKQYLYQINHTASVVLKELSFIIFLI